VIAPEVVDAIGGAAQARAVLAGVKSGEFDCVVCRQPGQFGDEPACVVVRILSVDEAPPVPVIKFAHPGCSASRVDRHAVLKIATTMSVYAVAWLEPTEPHPVLLIGGVTRLVHPAPGQAVADVLTAGLRKAGFVPVSDMTTPPAVLPGLTVHQSADGLVVYGADGQTFYDGDPVGDEVWVRFAQAHGRVRVLCASGLRLDNPRRDPMADLFTAIGKGHVVGATATYGSSRHAEANTV
jgi:hypothetical protein